MYQETNFFFPYLLNSLEQTEFRSAKSHKDKQINTFPSQTPRHTFTHIQRHKQHRNNTQYETV